MRPVINLRKLNKWVESQHFKMEGMGTLKELLRVNNWMGKVDLLLHHSNTCQSSTILNRDVLILASISVSVSILLFQKVSPVAPLAQRVL